MRPTFLGFETCKRGIATNQKVMDVIGQNLTNWDTEGYTRQRVDIVSVAPNRYATRYGSLRTNLAGQGVDMVGISQVRDPFLDKRFREEYGDAAYNGQVEAILTDIQSAIKEDGLDGSEGTAIQDALNVMYAACRDLASNASDNSIANLVSVAAKNLTQVIHELNSKLDNVAEQQIYDLGIAVNAYNDYGAKIAELNKVIRNDVMAQSQSEYYGPNELIDERNLLIDELSQYGDVDVANNKDGTVTIKVNGHTLVPMDDPLHPERENMGNSDIINMERVGDTVVLRWNSTGEAINTTTGSLKAYTDFVNGRGANMQNPNETIEKGVLYYKDKLDTLASTLASAFNSVIPEEENGAPKTDAAGNIIYKQLFGARRPATDALTGGKIPGEYVTDTDVPIDASNISISTMWENDSSYVMFQTGDKNPEYAMRMMALLVGDDGTTVFHTGGEKFVGSFQEYINDYTTGLGADVSYYQGRAKATAQIANEMLDRRDEVSGVSRDEETQNLMIYNKAFQAIARVLTTLDEALDVIINQMGLVGR